jgi:hypothetical protein
MCAFPLIDPNVGVFLSMLKHVVEGWGGDGKKIGRGWWLTADSPAGMTERKTRTGALRAREAGFSLRSE